MPQVTLTATSGSNWLTSKRQDDWGNWSTSSWAAAMSYSAIPAGAKIISAVLTVNVTQDPICGSYFYVDGQQLTTSMGTKKINISVSPGTSSRSVAVTFTGSGKTYSTAQMQVNMTLTIVYEYSASPLQRAESGALVKYRLYRAESGALVPYSVYRAESGALVKY